MRWIPLLVLVVMVTGMATGTATSQYANVSGPEFLRGIGPTEPRTDVPLAAAVTAVGVAAVILRGLRKDQQKDSS